MCEKVSEEERGLTAEADIEAIMAPFLQPAPWPPGFRGWPLALLRPRRIEGSVGQIAVTNAMAVDWEAIKGVQEKVGDAFKNYGMVQCSICGAGAAVLGPWSDRDV